MRTIKTILILGILGISHVLFAVTVFASPRISTTDVSETITVSIEVDEAIDFRGYKIVINYDSSLLTFDNAEQGTLFNGQPVGWWDVDDTTPGIIDVVCLIFGAGEYTTGPGNMLNLTFSTDSIGVDNLTFSETILYDILGNTIPGIESEDFYVIIGTPPAPNNIVINTSGDVITLSWQSIPNCTYNVYSSETIQNPENWRIAIADLNQNSWSCTILENENTMFYYVTAEFDTNLCE